MTKEIGMQWADRIGRRIKLRDLHVLMAVAEWGSMAKASEHLAITHPVVSKTISDLEHTLGVRLFDRVPRGVELTTYGQALLRCGAAVFDEMRQGLQRIESLADPSSGELRIGCPEIMIAGVVPPVAQEFLRLYPNVRLHVTHADTGIGQFHQLRERKVELLIGRPPRPFLEEDLIAEDLFNEPFRVYAGLQNPCARRRRIELAELIDEPWVLPPYESAPGALIAEIFRAQDLEPPRARVVTMSAQLSAVLVSAGEFVGLLPESVLRFNAKRLSLKVLPVAVSAPLIRVAVITVKNRTLTPVAERFIECARKMARALSVPSSRRP
jgi:DNA-binding transcriptional LysR family regulator